MDCLKCKRVSRECTCVRVVLNGTRTVSGLVCNFLSLFPPLPSSVQLNAGMPMKDLICACSAGISRDNFLVDLNSVEASSDGAELDVRVFIHCFVSCERRRMVKCHFVSSDCFVPNSLSSVRSRALFCLHLHVACSLCNTYT